MKLNLTLPGFGGGGEQRAPAAKPLVKAKYWTPDPNDETIYRNKPGFQGDAPEGYNPNDAYYKGKVWNKETQKWEAQSDDIYRYNSEGKQMMWQPSTPAKRGMLK